MKVKELMTPVKEYVTLGTEATLGDAAAAMATGKHNDILVVNEDGSLAGILTMTDILASLEPNYRRFTEHERNGETLTNRFVADIFKEFDLWSDTLNELCRKCLNVRVAEAMHVPGEVEYLDEEDNLEFGVHHYITGVHQPLIVRRRGEVTGLLRLADVFEEVRKKIISCGC